MRSLGTLVDHALGALPPGWLSAAARLRLVACGEQIDERVSALVVFEAPLVSRGSDGVSADLSFMVRRDGGAQLLVGTHGEYGVPAAWFEDSSWQAIQALAREWLDSSTPGGRAGITECLEFDLPANDVVPDKAGFFSPFQDHRTGGHPSAEHVLAVTQSVVATFRGHVLRESERALIDRRSRCERLTPIQVGHFAGRVGSPIGIEASTSVADLAPALVDVGWPGSPDLPAAAIANLLSVDETVICSFDLADRMLARPSPVRRRRVRRDRGERSSNPLRTAMWRR